MALSRAVVYPYKIASLSAKLLARGLANRLGLKVRRVKVNGTYRARIRSLLINYGANSMPTWGNRRRGIWLNTPEACARAGNKLVAFEVFKQAGLSCPEFTSDRTVADQWVGDGATVVCRTMLNAHSGRGIVLASRESNRPLVHAPLYVKYKKKRKEFRVHVFQGKTIDVAEKRKRRMEVRPITFDGYIRNLANGWVFCRDNVERPTDLDSLAINACQVLGLDFGAVDIVWNERDNKCYLLEVNTAPGLQGTTLENYTNAIYQWIKQQV